MDNLEISMAREIESSVVRLGFDGVWTPARQQHAIHIDAAFIEVSKKQFFASAGSFDALVSFRLPSETKGSGDCSKFTLRNGVDLGRIYSDGAYDQSGSAKKCYFLNVGFAQKMDAVLRANSDTSQAAEETHPRPRG